MNLQSERSWARNRFLVLIFGILHGFPPKLGSKIKINQFLEKW